MSALAAEASDTSIACQSPYPTQFAAFSPLRPRRKAPQPPRRRRAPAGRPEDVMRAYSVGYVHCVRNPPSDAFCGLPAASAVRGTPRRFRGRRATAGGRGDAPTRWRCVGYVLCVPMRPSEALAARLDPPRRSLHRRPATSGLGDTGPRPQGVGYDCHVREHRSDAYLGS